MRRARGERQRNGGDDGGGGGDDDGDDDGGDDECAADELSNCLNQVDVINPVHGLYGLLVPMEHM